MAENRNRRASRCGMFRIENIVVRLRIGLAVFSDRLGLAFASPGILSHPSQRVAGFGLATRCALWSC